MVIKFLSYAASYAEEFLVFKLFLSMKTGSKLKCISICSMISKTNTSESDNLLMRYHETINIFDFFQCIEFLCIVCVRAGYILLYD